ncbi:MAG TPA: ABC transporter permease [Candidatus Lokiarchaeia archaeon]|nr:ABC transporter permease [Candidatus Lokiarchaeia archaeon]
MDFTIIRAIVGKEFSTYHARRATFYALILLPIFLGLGLPVIIDFVISSNYFSPDSIILLEYIALTFFILLLTGLANEIASFSIVGERVEKSIEPLLAAPITDGELLLGKIAAAFLSVIAMLWAGAGLLVILTATIGSHFGLYIFTNWPITLILFVVIPTTCLFSVESGILISSKVTDPRAMQFALFGVAPALLGLDITTGNYIPYLLTF